VKKQADAQTLEVAHLAATYLIQGAADTFGSAKAKAARSLGLAANRNAPSNIDVQLALAENLSLFEGKDWHTRVRRMREEALRAMDFFVAFDPHLVGSVLYGTATEHSQITLHLYTDEFEQVVWRLTDAKITFYLTETMLKIDGKFSQEFPTLEMSMADLDFDLVVFPLSFRFNPPASPLDGKPYLRADAKKLANLIDSNEVLFGKYFRRSAAEQFK
jgi:hypothetical protein